MQRYGFSEYGARKSDLDFWQSSYVFEIRGISFSYRARLIPPHSIRVAASLVVLQGIGKRRGVAAEREIIAGIGRENHRARHIEAVQVA